MLTACSKTRERNLRNGRKALVEEGQQCESEGLCAYKLSTPAFELSLGTCGELIFKTSCVEQPVPQPSLEQPGLE
jgi:hypothetical protein